MKRERLTTEEEMEDNTNRMLVSDAATVGPEDEGRYQSLMIKDVSRVSFEAPMTRKVCIELSHKEGVGEDEFGFLLMSLCGTRDAAANFQCEVRKFMSNCGVAESVATNPQCTAIGRRKPAPWCGQMTSSRVVT